MTLIDMIKKEAKAAKWVGILLLVAGFLALIAPLAAGLSITMMIGVLLILGGVAQLLIVFRAGSFGEGLLLALLAILSLVAGIYMVSQPVSALATLTLFLAAYFVVTGIVEAIAAFGARGGLVWSRPVQAKPQLAFARTWGIAKSRADRSLMKAPPTFRPSAVEEGQPGIVDESISFIFSTGFLIKRQVGLPAPVDHKPVVYRRSRLFA